MKKIISTPVLISCLAVTTLSLFGAQPSEAKRIKEYGYCKTVKTSAGKYNVIRRSDNQKYFSDSNKKKALSFMYGKEECQP